MASSPRFKARKRQRGQLTGAMRFAVPRPGLSQQYGNLFRVSMPQSFNKGLAVGSWRQIRHVPQNIYWGMLCTGTLLECPSVHSSPRVSHRGLGLHVLHQAPVLLLHCASLCSSGRNWLEQEPRKLPSLCSNGPLVLLAQATIHPTLWSTSACLQLSWVSLCLHCLFGGGRCLSCQY